MLFASARLVIAGTPEWVGIVLRSINIVLAVWTAIFAALSIHETDSIHQECRFAGLSLLAVTVGWGMFLELDDPLTLPTPFFTVALMLGAYGSLGYLRKSVR